MLGVVGVDDWFGAGDWERGSFGGGPLDQADEDASGVGFFGAEAVEGLLILCGIRDRI